MGKSILTIVFVLLIVHLLAALGFFFYALGSGKFSHDRMEQYKAVWNGEKLVPPAPPEPEPAVVEKPQDSAERIAAAEVDQETTTREMQLQIQMLRDMAATVNAAQAKVDKEKTELAKVKEIFDQQLARQQAQSRQEGFNKALQTYSNMKPKNVKDDFMTMPDDEVVRYLAAMKADIATTILDSFKTPEEQSKRRRVMALLEELKKLDPFQTSNVKK